MNNQEAIGVLESINAKTDYFLINDDARAEAINMAISALQAQDLQPTCNQLAKDTNVPNKDCISRKAAIDTEGLEEEIRCEMCKNPMHTDRGCDGHCKYDEKLYEKIIQILDKRIKQLPSAQPEQSEITDVQAILHLQSTGWMQNHDKEMYESWQKSMLADDSGSYDALIPDYYKAKKRFYNLSFLQPESECVFYDNDHGFCINTQDVVDNLKKSKMKGLKMSKDKILAFLETAVDKNGDIPMRLVRQAFEKLPEPCEDAVSRNILKEYFAKRQMDADIMKEVFDAIDLMPSVALKRKTGKWIVHYECPKCGEITKDYTKYCPFCGADMR